MPKPAGLPPRRAPPVPAVPRGLNLSLPSDSQSPPGTAGERRRWKRRSLPLRSGRCVRCPCLCARSGSKGQMQTAAESGGRGAEARMPPTLGPSPACRSGGEATARPPAPGLTSAEGTACTGEHLTAQMPTAPPPETRGAQRDPFPTAASLQTHSRAGSAHLRSLRGSPHLLLSPRAAALCPGFPPSVQRRKRVGRQVAAKTNTNAFPRAALEGGY